VKTRKKKKFGGKLGRESHRAGKPGQVSGLRGQGGRKGGQEGGKDLTKKLWCEDEKEVLGNYKKARGKSERNVFRRENNE